MLSYRHVIIEKITTYNHNYLMWSFIFYKQDNIKDKYYIECVDIESERKCKIDLFSSYNHSSNWHFNTYI